MLIEPDRCLFVVDILCFSQDSSGLLAVDRRGEACSSRIGGGIAAALYLPQVFLCVAGSISKCWMAYPLSFMHARWCHRDEVFPHFFYRVITSARVDSLTSWCHSE